jgi:hypothetical protein
MLAHLTLWLILRRLPLVNYTLEAALAEMEISTAAVLLALLSQQGLHGHKQALVINH